VLPLNQQVRDAVSARHRLTGELLCLGLLCSVSLGALLGFGPLRRKLIGALLRHLSRCFTRHSDLAGTVDLGG
jgi:hypothetical protein